jgi:hypothetical protein
MASLSRVPDFFREQSSCLGAAFTVVAGLS